MKTPQYNIKRASKKSASKQEQKAILKRLTSPKKFEEAQALAKEASREELKGDSQPVTVEQPENAPETIGVNSNTEDFMESTDAPTTVVKEVPKDTNINIDDDGFDLPVVTRDYAEKAGNVAGAEKEKPIIPLNSAPKEEYKPTVVFAPKILKTDQTYKNVMGDQTGGNPASTDNPTSTPASSPEMNFQEPIAFDINNQAAPLNSQLGEVAGNTTSQWAFGMLENFYPELVAFFTKMPSDWIEKAKLPNELEADMLQKIIGQNAKNKNRVKISEFHKKNILPPLQRILAKKGWENVMPDELVLVIGLVVLAADSFFKIQEIKKENRVLEKQIKQKVQEYIDIRTAERKEIDALKGELGQMRAFMQQFKPVEQPAAA